MSGPHTRRLTLAQQALVEDARTQRMVRRMVAIFANMRRDVDRDELHALAQEALVLAAPLYDPARDVSFATFAARRVHGHVYRALYREWLQQTTNGMMKLPCDALPAPTDEQTAAATPAENQKSMRRWLLARGLAHVLITLHERQAGSPEERLRHARLRDAIQKAKQALPVDHAQLIERHYFEGVALRVLAEEMRVSGSAMSRLHRDALVRLRHELARYGFSTLPGDLLP